MSRLRRAVLALSAALALLLETASQAHATTTARIVGVDPRPGSLGAVPLLTTVVYLSPEGQPDVAAARCGSLRGESELACLLEGLEDARFIEPATPLPEDKASLALSQAPHPPALASVARWDRSGGESGAGTAWLIALDLTEPMRPRFAEARRLARAFVEAMAPGDVVELVLLDEAGAAASSKWLASKGLATNFVDGVRGPLTPAKSPRSLAVVLRETVNAALGDLAKLPGGAPMHQALVLIASRASAATSDAAPLRDAWRAGALGAKALPVVSIWLPPPATKKDKDDAERAAGRDFLAALADSSIGGIFTAVPSAAAAGRAERIVRAVRRRFDQMYLMRWRVPCLGPTMTLTLSFEGGTLAGDRVEGVSLGASYWPLEIDAEATAAHARAHPLRPGGTATVLGRFCWSGAHERAELLLLAPGQELGAHADPSGLLGAAVLARASEATADRVVFELPSDARFVHDEPLGGAPGRARLIVRDIATKQTSGATDATVLVLPAAPRRLAPWMFATLGGVAGLAAAAIVLLRRRRRAATTAAGGQRAKDNEAAHPDSGISSVAPYPLPLTPSSAVLEGAVGSYRIVPGVEARVGRDPGLCLVHLDDPRIAPIHATLKLQGSRLCVRDEGSPDGSRAGGVRLAVLAWTPVADGATLAFGPIEFRVRLE